MNVKYCPFCGFKNTWTVAKPKTCQKCSKEMEAAFKVSLPEIAPEQSIATNPVKKFTSARGNDLSHLINRPVVNQSETEYQAGDEDYVNESDLQNLAQHFANTIKASDFVIEMDEKPKTESLGSILGPILQQQQQEATNVKVSKKRKRTK